MVLKERIASVLQPVSLTLLNRQTPDRAGGIPCNKIGFPAAN